MNKISFLFVLLAMALFMSCGSKEKNEDAVDEDEWVQLDEFHEIMADVYHPLKDSGNLQPLKDRSSEFVAAVDKLAQSDLPAKVNSDEMEPLISALQESIHGLDEAIKAGSSDEQIGALLEGVHALFHTIQEEWYAGGAEHDEH